jgi:cytochrome c oxidase subunit 4
MHHTISRSTYFAVFLILMALLWLTVWVSHLHLGVFNLPAALAIAGLKAVLIMLYFMHVRYSPRVIWVWASAGFFWLLLLLSILDDFITRGWYGSGGR